MGKRRTLWDYNEMGLFFYSREAYDLAIAEFKRALKAAFYPTAALYVNLGAAYLGKKRYAEARAHLLKGLALEPRNQKAHWFLAQTLRRPGRHRKRSASSNARGPSTPTMRKAGRHGSRFALSPRRTALSFIPHLDELPSQDVSHAQLRRCA